MLSSSISKLKCCLILLFAGTKVSFIGYNDDALFQSNKTTENVTIMSSIISAVVLGRNVTDLKEQVVVTIIPSSKVKKKKKKTNRNKKKIQNPHPQTTL